MRGASRAQEKRATDRRRPVRVSCGSYPTSCPSARIVDIKTILNRCHPIRGFVYRSSSFGEHQTIHVEIRPRSRSQPTCSGCKRKGPTYDTAREPRSFTFIPLWGFAVVLWYFMRRVGCPRCGVTVEAVPWATGKERCCTVYQHFLAFWAKRLAWTEVARLFQTSWGVVFRAVQYVVTWGLDNRNLDGIKSVGIDEIAVWSGHRYLTVVYQIDAGARRLLWVGYGRTKGACRAFFVWLGKARRDALEFVASDMWRACIDVVAKWAPHAVHVLDRFHIVKRLNEAVDDVRRAEAKTMRKSGFQPLKHARWCLLKRPAKLAPSQLDKLIDLMRYQLRTVRAYLHKEAFEGFWRYRSAAWAGWFLDAWCKRVMRSRLEPLKRVARSLRNHRELILNWFRAKRQISQAVVEAMNGNAKLAIRKARGFRSYETVRIALYHQLGRLPEPEYSTHRFW
jgi:transposase